MTATTTSHPGRRAALGKLAIRLAEAGVAEASRADLDDLQPAIDELVEAGALVDRSGRIRFAHESLRDFVFAEAFAHSGESLREYLVANGQDLSDRWLVRQVLGYMRGVDRAPYTAVVADLLGDTAIRFHIRDIVFEALRADPDPSFEDWLAIKPFVLDETSRDHRAAWSVVIRPAWFALIDRIGLVINWMASEDEAVRNRATNLLRIAQRDASERVAVLLGPFLGVETDWKARIRWIVGGLGVRPGRKYLDLLLDCLARGLFDDGQTMQGDDLWMASHELPSNQPKWAVEVIDSYLKRGFELAPPESDPFDSNVFPRSEYWAREFVGASARHAPRSYVGVVLPPILDTADATASPSPSGDEVRVGDPWQYRWSSGQGELQWALFYGLDEALRIMARSKPRSLRPMLADLRAHADIESIRYLLYRAWAANPAQFSDDALDFLLGEPPPLICASATGAYGATRELIASVQVAAPRGRLHELQAHIAGFVPAWERTAAGRGEHRSAQWQLLNAFDEKRLSRAARGLLRELNDKFGGRVEEGPPLRTGTVASPIPEASAKRMNDEQWLGAIRTYDRDDMRVVGDAFKGGAIELSRLLEAETRTSPDRFAQLATALPDETHPVYVDAILRGLADGEALVQPELLFAALRHFFDMPGHPGGRWFQKPVARVADQDVPREILDMVVWFATQDVDPERDNLERYLDQGSNSFPNGPFTAGINSVRGVAAQTLSALIWPNASRLESLLPAVEAVAGDRTLAVRACAASAVRSVFRHNAEVGLKLFALLTDAHDVLLAEDPVEQLTAFVVINHYEHARGVLDRMREADMPRVKQAAGRLTAFAALFNPSAGDNGERPLGPDASIRLGVAQVAAANVGHADHQKLCEQWLAELFYDEDERIRNEASGWCRSVTGETLGMLIDLIGVYIGSPAYADDEQPLLWALDDSPAPISEVALRAVEVFIKRRDEQIGDITTSAAGAASTASKLAMRAYASSETTEMRNRALDSIDRLLAARVSQMDELVGHYDPGPAVRGR